MANTGRGFQLVLALDAAIRTSSRSAGGRSCSRAGTRLTRATRTRWTARFASRLGHETGPSSSPRWAQAASTSARSCGALAARSSRRTPGSSCAGLIHSDGCRTVNRFKTRLPSGRVAEYAYPRYFFSDLSADIRGLFCASCERLGLRWTQSNHRNISISHRTSVALLDENVGPKCERYAARRACLASAARRRGRLAGSRCVPAQAVKLAGDRLAGLLHDLHAARAAHEVQAHQGAIVAAGLEDEHVGALGAQLARLVAQASAGGRAHQRGEAVGRRAADDRGDRRHRVQADDEVEVGAAQQVEVRRSSRCRRRRSAARRS